MSSMNGVNVVDDRFGESLDLPSFEAGQDAEAILVDQMIRAVALPVETLDWLLFAERYCQVDEFGRRLADRYVELFARASTGRFKRMTDVVEALALKRFLPRLPGMPGGGGGGFGGSK